MSLTENSNQLFLPGRCNRTQNLRFGPYTKLFDSSIGLLKNFLNKVLKSVSSLQKPNTHRKFWIRAYPSPTAVEHHDHLEVHVRPLVSL